MPSSSLTAFAARYNALEEILATDVPNEIVVQAATIYAGVIRDSIYAVTRGGRLSGVGKNGARVGVRTVFNGSRSAIVQATGPLQLIERDTSAHAIPRVTSSRRLRTAAGRLSHKRESTGRALSGRTILVINGSVITGPVQHPGTTGKHPFERGADAAAPAGVAAASIVFNRSLESLFQRG